MTDPQDLLRLADRRLVGKLSNGTTVESNIAGFELLNGENLAHAMVAAGLMTQAECDAALARRAARAHSTKETSNG